MLQAVGAGEALGLVFAGEIWHSVYRPPNQAVFVDAHGVSPDLDTCARRYASAGETWTWQSLTEPEVARLAAGADRTRLRRMVRAARPIAKSLLAIAPCWRAGGSIFRYEPTNFFP